MRSTDEGPSPCEAAVDSVGPMFVLAMEVDLHVNDSQSLKAKRQVVKSLVDTARHRFGVSAAEIGGQDLWQRATLGFAVVAPNVRGSSGHGQRFRRMDDGVGPFVAIDDVRAVLDWVERQRGLDARRVGVHGVGLGGTLAVIALEVFGSRLTAGSAVDALIDPQDLASLRGPASLRATPK